MCITSNGLAGSVCLVLAVSLSLPATASGPRGKPQPPPPPPTPEKIVFVRTVKVKQVTADQVFTMNTDGTGVTQLTSDSANKFETRWSPDLDPVAPGYQGKLAYVVNQRNLFVSNSDGSSPTQVFSLGNVPQSITVLDWSPDGAYIAFVVGLPSWGVLVYDCATGQTSQVVSDTVLPGVQSVSWTPDLVPGVPGYQGKLMLSTGTGQYGIYALNAEYGPTAGLSVGDSPEYVVYGYVPKVTNTPTGGLRMAYKYYVSGTSMLGVADVAYNPLDGTITVTNSVGLALPVGFVQLYGPRWSPDGLALVVAADDGSYVTSREVFRVALPEPLGSGVVWTRLTTNTVMDNTPDWSPTLF